MSSRNFTFEHEYDQIVGRNDGLGQLFFRQARQTPQAIAVIDGDVTLTYAALHYHACELARRLSTEHFTIEEPVGIIVQPGIADIITQLAVLYAGGICTPVDSSLPDHLIQHRLTRLGVRCVLTDKINRNRRLPYRIVCLESRSDDATAIMLADEDAYPLILSLEHCTHLIHTSGTTDEPKAVRIQAKSILHVIFHAPFRPLLSTDVVAHANQSSFDVSLFDIWAPLIRGARIAVFPKNVLLNPPLIAQEIDRLGITVMITTTAVLNLAAYTNPTSFAKLRLCIIGGEAANVAAIKLVLDHGPPEMLINAYGPTECCIFCLAHRIEPEDVRRSSVSIGKPIGRTVAHIVDDAGRPSDEGELWIGGPGVSPGYFGRPEQDAVAFQTLDRTPNHTEDTIRFYRTGDMVRRWPTGQIDYIGRQDHQVKVRGHRIELGAVEVALLKTGLFAEAVAIKFELPQRGAGSILVAYVVPSNLSEPPELHDAVVAAKALLPDYMVPRLEYISRMPLTSHAKVDRKRLLELCGQRWSSFAINGHCQDVRSALGKLWTRILGTSASINENDYDFISLGGTSLQASVLLNQLRQTFGIDISLVTLYNNMKLSSLASVVESGLNGQQATLPDEESIWIEDSKIADNLPCPLGPVVDWSRETEGRVFITGATGFVGAFLLADLLRMSTVFQVGCLIRARDPAAAFDRVKESMAKYDLWQECFADKLLAFPGRLEDERFGLMPDRYQELALWASVVFHLGAMVNYTQPYSLHRPANTIGTRNVVVFASTGRCKQIHYVSSVSCFGPTGFATGATDVYEEEPLLPHLVGLKYDHGYAQSQWVADQLLQRLIARGFPITVYRPGFITGHSQTGACNADDFMSRLIHACDEMACYPLLPNQRKECVPVDYVCAVLLHIAQDAACYRHTYHVLPPPNAVNPDMNTLMNLVGQVRQRPMRGMPYAEWAKSLQASSPQRLLPLQPMLTEPVHSGLSRWELHENMPKFHTTNTDTALQTYPGSLKFPALDRLLVEKYLQFLDTKA